MDGTRHEVAKAVSISLLLFSGSLALCFAILGEDPTNKLLAWTYSFPPGRPTTAACVRIHGEAAALRTVKQPYSYILLEGLQQCETLLAGNTEHAHSPPAR